MLDKKFFRKHAGNVDEDVKAGKSIRNQFYETRDGTLIADIQVVEGSLAMFQTFFEYFFSGCFSFEICQYDPASFPGKLEGSLSADPRT